MTRSLSHDSQGSLHLIVVVNEFGSLLSPGALNSLDSLLSVGALIARGSLFDHAALVEHDSSARDRTTRGGLDCDS